MQGVTFFRRSEQLIFFFLLFILTKSSFSLNMSNSLLLKNILLISPMCNHNSIHNNIYAKGSNIYKSTILFMYRITNDLHMDDVMLWSFWSTDRKFDWQKNINTTEKISMLSVNSNAIHREVTVMWRKCVNWNICTISLHSIITYLRFSNSVFHFYRYFVFYIGNRCVQYL